MLRVSKHFQDLKEFLSRCRIHSEDAWLLPLYEITPHCFAFGVSHAVFSCISLMTTLVRLSVTNVCNDYTLGFKNYKSVPTCQWLKLIFLFKNKDNKLGFKLLYVLASLFQYHKLL